MEPFTRTTEKLKQRQDREDPTQAGASLDSFACPRKAPKGSLLRSAPNAHSCTWQLYLQPSPRCIRLARANHKPGFSSATLHLQSPPEPPAQLDAAFLWKGSWGRGKGRPTLITSHPGAKEEGAAVCQGLPGARQLQIVHGNQSPPGPSLSPALLQGAWSTCALLAAHSSEPWARTAN